MGENFSDFIGDIVVDIEDAYSEDDNLGDIIITFKSNRKLIISSNHYSFNLSTGNRVTTSYLEVSRE